MISIFKIFVSFPLDVSVAEIADGFLNGINGVQLNDHGASDDAYIQVTLHKRELADGCWFLRARDLNDVKTYALFVDAKSGQIGAQSASAGASDHADSFTSQTEQLRGTTRSKVKSLPDFETIVGSESRIEELRKFLPKGGAQAHRLRVIAERLRTMQAAAQDGRDGPEGFSITPGSLAEALVKGDYLYVYVSTKMEGTFGIDDHIVHLGRSDSECFLGFLKEPYEVNRSLWNQ